MTPDQHQSIVDQFDQRKGEKPGNGPTPPNAETQEEWDLLEVAVDAIRLHAITEHVRNARMRFEQEQRDLEPVVPVGKLADMVDARRRSTPALAVVPAVRRRISPMLQIAAAFMLVVVSAGIIKVASTRPEGVFERNYTEYQLSITRGTDVSDELEKAYQRRNWAAVFSAFDATHTRTQKDYFLTAMAHMEQKEYYEAISLLKTLILYNKTKEPLFEDEAEYYLAMNYLATGEAAPAVELFDKIKGDPRHTYHSVVERMGRLDLGILRMK